MACDGGSVTGRGTLVECEIVASHGTDLEAVRYDERAHLRRVRPPYAGQHAHGVASPLAPVFIYLIVSTVSRVDGARRFLAAMSDYFDGIVARRHGTTTSGAFSRPAGDKVIVLGSLYALILARPHGPHGSSFRRDHHASRDLDERLSLPRGAARNSIPASKLAK